MGPQPDQARAGHHRRVDRHVVRLGGEVVDELPAVQRRDDEPPRAREGPVVRPAAAAEPRAGAVDGEGGHDEQGAARDGRWAQRRARRLQQPPGSRAQVPLVRRPVEVAVRQQQRQQHRPCPAGQHGQERPRPRLRADRGVRRDRSGGQAGEGGDHGGGELSSGLLPLGARHL